MRFEAASSLLTPHIQTLCLIAQCSFLKPRLSHLIPHFSNLFSTMSHHTFPRPSVPRTPRRDANAGFTLVEILVVIVIIGILAAVAIPAVNIAVTRAKTAAMKLEVTGVDSAVSQYQEKYGDYPPDFSNYNVVLRHYRKLFPRMSANDSTLLFNLLHVARASSKRQTWIAPKRWCGASTATATMFNDRSPAPVDHSRGSATGATNTPIPL